MSSEEQVDSDPERLDSEDEGEVPLLDEEVGRGVEMEGIGEEWQPRAKFMFADKIPEWDPTSRAFGIYPPAKDAIHGTVITVVGPVGQGKTRVLQTLGTYAWPMVHRALLVSATNERSMQFDDLNMFQSEAIIEHPRVRMLRDWIRERRAEMRIWRDKRDRGEPYTQRAYLYMLDDMGFAARLLFYRAEEMMELFANRRHLAWHGWIALQHMGQMNKLMRMEVGIYIFVREQLAGGLAAMWDVCFRGSQLSPRMFRQMVDEVCIKGKRVLVFIPSEGRLFKWTLPEKIAPLPRPLGSSAWHQLGRENRLHKRVVHRSGRELMVEALRERREDDEAERRAKERARARGTGGGGRRSK